MELDTAVYEQQLWLEMLEEKLNRKIYDLFRAEFATTVLNTCL